MGRSILAQGGFPVDAPEGNSMREESWGHDTKSGD